MGWVNDARRALAAGRAITITPHGGSMRGRIESGQAITLAPVDPKDIQVDDIALIAWRGNFLLHLVLEAEPTRLLIGNNLGKINGWVPREAALGRVVEAHPSG